MRIVVLGPTGQVGGMLVEELEPCKVKENYSVYTIGRRDSDYNLDVNDSLALGSQLNAIEPDVIINAVAYTAVDKAESEAEIAMALNCDLPSRLADWCETRTALLIHYSTDFVFDGSQEGAWQETDTTQPLSVYGETKLAGEKALAMSSASSIILRTSWVYGETGNNFLNTMLRLGREREHLAVVDDQRGVPTYSRDLARATLKLIELFAKDRQAFLNQQKLYHLSSQGETTWYGFAKHLFEIAAHYENLSLQALKAISTAEYPTPANRPKNSVMNCEQIFTDYGIQLPHWRSALQEVMSRVYG